MHDERTVRLAAEKRLAGDEETAVGEPLGRPAEPGTARRRNLAVPFEVDGQNLLGSPMREPQPAVMPARRLDVRQTVDEDPNLGCGGLRCHGHLPASEQQNTTVRADSWSARPSRG